MHPTTRDVRLRTRTQIVLLSIEQGLPAAAIARIVRESKQTVRNCLKRYLAEDLAACTIVLDQARHQKVLRPTKQACS